jgi:hypothetical protein
MVNQKERKRLKREAEIEAKKKKAEEEAKMKMAEDEAKKKIAEDKAIEDKISRSLWGRDILGILAKCIAEKKLQNQNKIWEKIFEILRQSIAEEEKLAEEKAKMDFDLTWNDFLQICKDLEDVQKMFSHETEYCNSFIEFWELVEIKEEELPKKEESKEMINNAFHELCKGDENYSQRFSNNRKYDWLKTEFGNLNEVLAAKEEKKAVAPTEIKEEKLETKKPIRIKKNKKNNYFSSRSKNRSTFIVPAPEAPIPIVDTKNENVEDVSNEEIFRSLLGEDNFPQVSTLETEEERKKKVEEVELRMKNDQLEKASKDQQRINREIREEKVKNDYPERLNFLRGDVVLLEKEVKEKKLAENRIKKAEEAKKKKKKKEEKEERED